MARNTSLNFLSNVPSLFSRDAKIIHIISDERTNECYHSEKLSQGNRKHKYQRNKQ